MLDGPPLGLAPIIVQQVHRVIADIRRQGTTVLLVEKNANMALSVTAHRSAAELADAPAKFHSGICACYAGRSW